MKLNSANINVMVNACRKASKNLIRDFGEVENLQVSIKGPGDFVTMTDKKVEKILIDELLKARSNYSILSEEIGEIKNDLAKQIFNLSNQTINSKINLLDKQLIIVQDQDYNPGKVFELNQKYNLQDANLEKK